MQEEAGRNADLGRRVDVSLDLEQQSKQLHIEVTVQGRREQGRDAVLRGGRRRCNMGISEPNQIECVIWVCLVGACFVCCV